MCVLAVQIDEQGAALGQLARGGEAAVDVRAAATLAGDHPGQHRLVARSGAHEPPLDARLGGAVAHQRGVGATAEEQIDGLDDERLARTGLAGDGGESGPEDQVEIGDDSQVDDVEFDEHRRRASH